MDIGVTGHQDRPGIDWKWASYAVRRELSKMRDVERALSSLAAGSDQLFAQIAMELGINVVAVIPLDGYDRYFDSEGLRKYRRLLSRCEARRLHWRGEAERAFLEAGKYVVDNCDVLLAIWDGEAVEGPGGTADVVRYAKQIGRRVIHINPMTQQVSHG